MQTNLKTPYLIHSCHVVWFNTVELPSGARTASAKTIPRYLAAYVVRNKHLYDTAEIVGNAYFSSNHWQFGMYVWQYYCCTWFCVLGNCKTHCSGMRFVDVVQVPTESGGLTTTWPVTNIYHSFKVLCSYRVHINFATTNNSGGAASIAAHPLSLLHIPRSSVRAVVNTHSGTRSRCYVSFVCLLECCIGLYFTLSFPSKWNKKHM